MIIRKQVKSKMVVEKEGRRYKGQNTLQDLLGPKTNKTVTRTPLSETPSNNLRKYN